MNLFGLFKVTRKFARHETGVDPVGFSLDLLLEIVLIFYS